ncbi:MAG: histidine kinase [Clostridia bacterium]|nr:histidine kinase [Clostridia bacterium]
MSRILDKVLIFTLCLIFYLPIPHTAVLVVPVLAAVTASAFLSLFERREAALPIFALFCLICVFYHDFLFFLPLVCYDVFVSGPFWAAFFAVIPVAADYTRVSPFVTVTVLMVFVLVFLTERRTGSLLRLQTEYASLRDTAKEFSLRLENRNRELMEKQDYEVRLATLRERNRIAREIHDSVGHLLTSSILQIGALLATCRDEPLRENLRTLQGTLTKGMDSIRNSIHNLYDESIDLDSEVQTLVKEFSFCPVTLRCEIGGSPSREIKYTLIAVLKEALSNVAHHSNATHLDVTLREHPGFYQMVVKDNGTKKPEKQGSGIGLQNICSRVEGLHGHINIETDGGFRLFISIPREDAE